MKKRSPRIKKNHETQLKTKNMLKDEIEKKIFKQDSKKKIIIKIMTKIDIKTK